jgi:hypothetical protein
MTAARLALLFTVPMRVALVTSGLACPDNTIYVD